MLFTPKKIPLSSIKKSSLYFFAFSLICFFILSPLSKIHAQSATDASSGVNDYQDTDLSGTDDSSAAIIQSQQEEQAASDQAGPTSDDIDLTTTPENPASFTNVDVHIASDLVDLNRYKETWVVDGKTVQSGIGIRDITVETKDYGQTTNVSVAIALPGTTLEKQFVLEPEDLTMMWEAVDSYVPPFYQGKKLPSKEGFIKVVAIPNFQTNGKSFDPSTGVYIWKRNGNIVSDAGGYGKDSFLFKNDSIRDIENIDVDASDVADANEAERSINIPIFNPFILFYEKKTTTGVENPMATNTLYLNDPSTSVTAEPYFFSTSNGDPAKLSWDWTMNGNPLQISDPTNPETLTLNNPKEQGVATLDLNITNPTTLFQTAENNLNVIFNEK